MTVLELYNRLQDLPNDKEILVFSDTGLTFNLSEVKEDSQEVFLLVEEK